MYLINKLARACLLHRIIIIMITGLSLSTYIWKMMMMKMERKFEEKRIFDEEENQRKKMGGNKKRI